MLHCKKPTIWHYRDILWPLTTEAPEPNADLPPEIRTDYDEAGSILNQSPRGAAALLRLAIQKLCQHLKAEGKDLNANIADLVRKGLDEKVQKALDVVRVVGNHAVHPGQIKLDDDRDAAISLFKLVNLIAGKMISEPAHIDAMYEGLPDQTKEAIRKRDKQ